MARPVVLICGAPTSGNRAVARAIDLLGVKTHIAHPTLGPTAFLRELREKCEPLGRVFGLMPVRSPVFRDQSKALEKHGHGNPGIRDLIACAMTAGRAFEMDSNQWMPLSYEGFVEHPREHLELIAGWLGVDVPEGLDLSWVEDGNEKYRVGA